MAELIYRHMYKVDVANDPLIRRDVGALLGLYDKAANRFGVELYDNGTALTVSGKTVTGYMIRPDGVTVDISGTASGNQAYVELKENCYLYDGAFTLSLKVDAQTVLICDGQIAVTRTGTTVSGNEVINTVSSAEMLGGKTPEYYLTPVNLLDNSNLLEPVNQRGYANDTTVENTYFIDRWNVSGASSFSLGTNGMEIKSGFCHQIVSISQIKSGHAYTLACKMNGNILCYNGVAEETIGTWEDGLVTIYYAGQGVTIYLTKAGATYEWVALYEGAYTADTLPPYVPKPYVVELAECQRYFVDFGDTVFRATKKNDTLWALNIQLPIQMRLIPSIAAELAEGVQPETNPNTSKSGVSWYGGSEFTLTNVKAIADL